MTLSKRQTESHQGIIRKRDYTVAGLWAGKSKAKRDDVHAVGAVDELGARTSACKLVGRFIPTWTEWKPWENHAGQCEDCLEILRGARNE